MKKIILLLAIFVFLTFQLHAQARAVSLKQEAWDLGDNLSLAELAYLSTKGDYAFYNRTVTIAEAKAKNLGINLPRLPDKTSGKNQDTAKALIFLQNKEGTPLEKILAEGFSDEYAAIFEISAKSNFLLMFYATDRETTESILNVINQKLEKAKLPKVLLAKLNNLVQSNAEYKTVKEEVLAFHTVTSKYIASTEFSDIGEAYFAKKELAKSVAAFGNALQIFPTEPKFLFLRGRSNLELGRYLEAIADFTKVIKFEIEKSKLPRTYEGRGLGYWALGKNALAIADLTMALKLRPNNALTYKLRSRVYKHIGNLKLAAADYQMAESLQPGIMN